jgi:hypothetical protein
MLLKHDKTCLYNKLFVVNIVIKALPGKTFTIEKIRTHRFKDYPVDCRQHPVLGAAYYNSYPGTCRPEFRKK